MKLERVLGKEEYHYYQVNKCVYIFSDEAIDQIYGAFNASNESIDSNDVKPEIRDVIQRLYPSTHSDGGKVWIRCAEDNKSLVCILKSGQKFVLPAK